MAPKQNKPIERWRVLKSAITYRDEWLTLRSDTVLLPNGQTLSPFHTIEGPDWINVIAISAADNVILLEEYRHGAKRALLQLPGGHVEGAELPELTARRELLEETGYGGGTWHDVGTLFPVAARLTNRLHTFLAVGVQQIASPKPGIGEIIQVQEIVCADFLRGIRSGSVEFIDATQLASLCRLHLFATASSDPSIARLRL